MSITYGSVCSGIESASVAWEPLGMTPTWFSEIEPFPCAVLKHHWPHVDNLGDMTLLPDLMRRGKLVAPDILVGGTPCFTAGHQVLTNKGYVDIGNIKPGDLVVTHKGVLKPVIRIGSKETTVGLIKGVGISGGIECTPDHPFLSVDFVNQSTRRKGVYTKVEHCGEPKWTPAKDMTGKQWCSLTEINVPHSKIPDEWMYIAGFYLGDGYVRGWGGKNKKAVVFGINDIKLEKFRENVTSEHFSVTNERTGPRVTICNTLLAKWLMSEFKHYSHLKTIPPWVMSADNRGVLLRGYLDADGHINNNGWRSVTTSKSLANGLRDLANTLGFVSSISFRKTKDFTVIEGRTVNQRDYWEVNSFNCDSSKKSRVRHGMILRKVQSFKLTGSSIVYNIEVAGDNSYILDGVIVHNCQAFSIAGKQLSMDDARGQLTLVYGDLLNAIDNYRWTIGKPPTVSVWENVPGVLSTADNAFGWFLGLLAGEFTLADCFSGTAQPLEAQPCASRQKWPKSGCVIGPIRTVAWRILDAQHFGVAQRRRRVFVVASARAGFDPAKVLFECEGMRRDFAPSREKQKSVENFTYSKLAGGGQLFGCLMRNVTTKHWLSNQEAFSGNNHIIDEKGIRNPTMSELCKIQGFPSDFFDWCDQYWKSAGALGNSKAVPVVQWIGKRILKELNHDY